MMEKFRKKICVMVLLSVLSSGAGKHVMASNANVPLDISQQKSQLKGVINDELGPATGATISVKGSTIGTTTDLDGNFTLNDIPQGATLVVSFIGYETQEIAYTGQTTLEVLMQENSKLLDEVVVTALGIKKDRRALSYAIGEVKGEELRNVPTQNLSNSLYGKVAGMRIQGTAGGPMGGTKIQLRGINSIAGTNRPLIVLDGVPIYDDDSAWKGRDRNQTQNGSALNDINPEDIETMSVLKGANAAALYGSRATNGVILITTKKGSKSKGLGIDVSSSYTTNRLAYLPEYQNVFGQGTKPYFDKFTEGGTPIPQYDTYRSFGPLMDGTDVQWWDGVTRSFSPQEDNFKDFFQNGFTNNNTISISNGTETTNIRLSYANTNYEGILKNMEEQKHNFNLSGSAKLSSRITLDASVTYNRTNRTNPATRIDRVSNFPMPRSERSQLYLDNYKDEKGYFMTDAMRNNLASSNKDNIVEYLLWQQRENRYVSNKDRIMGNIAANIKIIEPLNLRMTIGTDRIRELKQDKEMFKQYSAPTDDKKEGLYRKRNDDYTKKFYEAVLMFNKSLNERFDLSLMGGASAEDIRQSTNLWQSNGLLYNGMFSTNNNKFLPEPGKIREAGTNESELMYSVYGSGQLGYNHYLYLDITARNDWNSRLPKDNRSFFYPSVGLGFVFTDAFKLPNWLTYGKVRASYAIVGNATPSRYFANNLYTIDLFNNTIFTNSFEREFPSGTIEPEKTHSWEFGLELKALNNRIGLDLAYFNSETRNQILAIAVPTSSGANKFKTNAGTLANQGLELQLNGTPISTKDFTWTASANFSYVDTELKSFIEGLEDYEVGGAWDAKFNTRVGAPVYGIYLKKWKRDASGNIVVDSNGKYLQEGQSEFYADAMAKYIGGFSTSFRYKDFTLNASIDGQIGGKIVSFTNNYLKSSGAGKESLFGRNEEYGGIAYYVLNGKRIRLDSHSASAPNGLQVHHDGVIAPGVKADGTTNDIIVPAETYYNDRYNKSISEDNVYDNTYFKFRELSLTYQIPSSIYSKLKLQSLSVSLIANDLFYIYKNVPNINPESSLGTSGVNSYIEYTAYPSNRSFGFSVKTKF